MKGEDIFRAIGMVDDEHFVRCENQRSPSVTHLMEGSMMKKQVLRARKAWMIAAAIALTISLAGGVIAAVLPKEPDTSTIQALEELGDYTPGYLPEGFEEQSVLGSPLGDGGGWYSYVWKNYTNEKADAKIFFEYKTYRIATHEGYVDDAKTACSFMIPGSDILNGIVAGEEAEVNGMYALVGEHDVAWADPDIHVVYHLHSTDVSGNELLRIAQSMRNNG